MTKKYNYIFISIILSIILLGNITLIRTQKETSNTENRSLQKFEHFTINSYITGEYQSNLETAFSDQFIGGETIKLKLKAALNLFDYNNIPKSICKNKYVRLSGSYYSFDCNDSIVIKNVNEIDVIIENIKNRLNVYSKLNNYVDTYYYFLSTPGIFDFEAKKYSVDLYKILKENLTGKYKIESLEFKDYDEYIKYFYKTDHHWNHRGSYEAYKDIISMVRPNDQFIKPIEEVVFDDIIFYGSSARLIQNFNFKENFKVYNFNFPKMEILNNRIGITYGHEIDYLNGIYSKHELANHYGDYYGGDSAEVVFTTNKNKYNALILGSSYTNAIDKLIASHFNKTYDVDLRHYEKTFNEKFDIKEYIKKNKIDKVIILADYNFLVDDSFDIEWSE